MSSYRYEVYNTIMMNNRGFYIYRIIKYQIAAKRFRRQRHRTESISQVITVEQATRSVPYKSKKIEGFGQ